MGFSDLKKALKKIDSTIKDQKAKRETSQSQDASEKKSSEKRDQKPFHVDVATDDIFAKPLSTEAPPGVYKKIQHVQKPQGCNYGESDEPIQTNNFSNNLTLEDQTFPVWTMPYSLWLTKDPGQDVGVAVNHTEAAQQVFGPDAGADPAQFYFNPPKIKSFVFSGQGIGQSNGLTLLKHQKLSVEAKLSLSGKEFISFPLVHGMGFVTAVYKSVGPIIASQVGVQHFKKDKKIGNVQKYLVVLFNQVVWSLYVDGGIELSLKDPNHIIGDKGDAVIQLARGDSGHLDESAGIYPVAAHLKGSVSGSTGRYSFVYENKGSSANGSGLVWCFPHHQEVLTDKVRKKDTGLTLDSTTKGVMKAYTVTELEMEESDLPTHIGWEPWSSLLSFKAGFSNEAKRLIKEAAEKEVLQDIEGMANIDSMYTSGKIVDKFAFIAYVTHFILNDDELTKKVLDRVKKAVEIFANNKQPYPLVYDTVWKGLVSSADPGADFGNSNYNDHHFHYGYHVHAISLIAKVDQSFAKGQWLDDNNGLVREYATTLIRDYANPSTQDKYFPQLRSFDWFHGHSFAHGIFASGDGKDEESSSEDYHSIYGIRLFGEVIGDKDMQARANLQLAIMKRSINMYMLFSDDNKIQPKRLIKNKVSGIYFENKIDYSTYFGRGTIGDEWIHGIHMLPITPVSSYFRSGTFVKEEWDQKLASIVDKIPDAWRGVLMLNAALFDPQYAWKWFASKDFDERLLDNGMSRTWSLAYIAGIGGSN